MTTPELPPSAPATATTAATAANAAHTPVQPLHTGLRLLMPLGCIVALLVLLLVVLGLTGRWLLRTPDGGRWLLSQVPGVQVQGFDGVLWGGRWRADKLRVQWDSNKQWVEAHQLQAEGVQWQWQPQADVWLGLQASSLSARRVVVETGPPSGRNPLPLPASIAPPLQLRFAQVRAAELQIDTLPLVRDAALDALVLDARPGADFSAERFSFDGFGVVAAGQLRMATTAPLALSGHAAVRPSAEGDSPRWGAVLDASGSFA
jgi:translocation and assembly module TamB